MSLIIEGGRRLCGDLTVQGAKNSVLPILAACILSGDVCVLQRCPRLEDVDTSVAILRHLGCAVRWVGPDLVIPGHYYAGDPAVEEFKLHVRSFAPESTVFWEVGRPVEYLPYKINF